MREALALAEEDADGRFSDVEALVRYFVTSVLGMTGTSGEGGRRPDTVILDLEVDGVRCRLVRLPKAPLPLTPREREIARMVAMGYPNKRIAACLDISSWTVATHLRRIFLKLGVSSRAAMVARMLEDK